MTKFKIPVDALEAIGGEAVLREAITTFQKALKDHSKTIGQPAPTAHPVVERIVRQGGGKFEIIEPEIPVEAPIPRTSETAFAEIKQLRIVAMNSGVSLRGVKIDSSPETLNALVAATYNDEVRWRVGPGAFLKFNKDDVLTLIKMIRAKHQRAFDQEFYWSDIILAADTPEKLAALDFSKGWGD